MKNQKQLVPFHLRMERQVYDQLKKYQATHRPRMSLAGIINEAVELACNVPANRVYRASNASDSIGCDIVQKAQADAESSQYAQADDAVGQV